MELWVEDSGMSDDKIKAGVDAAQKVLAAVGVPSEKAYAAMNAMLEGEDDFDRVAAEAWENAETAAFRTLFAGMERWPESASLTLK